MLDLKIDTSNDAFNEQSGGPGVELAANLKNQGIKAANGAAEGQLRDTNGSAVESYKLTEGKA